MGGYACYGFVAMHPMVLDSCWGSILFNPSVGEEEIIVEMCILSLPLF
jgi:hypothetical protein